MQKRRRPALGGPSSRIFRGDLKLRAGPPTVGVIVRTIIVVAGQQQNSRRKREKVEAAGNGGMHG
jgi:hypothetical protein